MKRIKLTHEQYALVDDKDFKELNQHKWWLDSSGYAVRDIGGRKNKKRVLMHRLINNTLDGLHTDHINHNKLDNRRSNLRSLTCSQNILNSKLSKNNQSGHNGVYWNKGKWVAAIKINYRKIHLGRYEKLTEAIIARKKAEDIYFEV